MTARQASFAPAVVRFFVPGIPEPQGSASVFMLNGHPRITTANPKLKAWRKQVALAYQGEREGPITSPVIVRAQFRFERPRSVSTHQLYPLGREGDLDKLCRGLLDGLAEPVKLLQREGGGETVPVLRDDVLVVDLHASKRYAGPGQQPGVLVEVEVLPGRS